jgi:hypothetical protein
VNAGEYGGRVSYAPPRTPGPSAVCCMNVLKHIGYVAMYSILAGCPHDEQRSYETAS